MNPSHQRTAGIRLLGVRVLIERSSFVMLSGTAIAFAWFTKAMVPQTHVLVALAIGILAALGIAGSLLVHELAHARVSLHAGIAIDYIRLHAGGAVCKRKLPAENAGDQFRIAAAGPIASTALAVITLTAAFAVELLGLSSAGSAALWFIAFANVMIAVSNLLPVFPLDGAKLMHSLFWRSSGDYHAATKRLRESGREFARIVIALGIVTAAWPHNIVLGMVIVAFGIYLHFLPPPAA